MIGQCQRFDLQARATQRRKETLGGADAGGGQYALARKVGKRPGERRLAHTPCVAQRERQPPSVGPFGQGSAVRVVDQVGVAPARQRFAQRACRQQETVAAESVIEDGDLDVAGQRVMLKAVVAHDDVAFGVRVQQGLAPFDAGGPDPYGGARAFGDQQRLVADIFRTRLNTDFRRPGQLCPVATREHPRCVAVVAQGGHKRDDGRRFAGTADREVADDDHRDRQPRRCFPAPAETHAPPRGNRAEDPRERPQQPGDDAPALPLSADPMHQRARQARHERAGARAVRVVRAWGRCHRDGFAGASCAVVERAAKVRRDKPASRAASITLMTDW